MNKKSVIILVSVLILLSLGVFYVMGTVSDDIAGATILAEFTPGDGYGVSNWTKSGLNATLNITITIPNMLGVADGELNITNIWFETPTHVVLDDFANVSNSSGVVYDSDGVISKEWSCEPTAASVGGTADTYSNLSCTNWTQSQLGEGDSFTLRFNYSGNLSGDELPIVWNIPIWIVENFTDGAMEGSFLPAVSTNQDDQYPRLIEVNISDGNTTYANSTWGSTYFLNGQITIESLIEDSQLEGTVLLGYLCNSSNASVASDNTGAGTEQSMTLTDADAIGIINHRVKAVTLSSINCDTVNVGGYAGANETFNFVFLVNDTFNHRIQLNNTGDASGQIGSFWMTMDDGELLPTIAKVNVTQTTKSSSYASDTSVGKTLTDSAGELNGANDYLAANLVTFSIELLGGYKPDVVTIVWNDTGASTTTLAPAVIGDTGSVFPHKLNLDVSMALNATNSTAGAAQSGDYPDSGDQAVLNETSVFYTATLNLGGNGSDGFAFWIVANNTGKNYTRIGGPYRFTVDGSAPSLTMTPPTDLVITPRASITYKCTMTDSVSGNNKIMWQLKKPSETEFTTKQSYENVGTDGSDSVTFTGDDTNLAGDYDVRCIALDAVGNENTYTTSSSETFSVHYSTAEGAAEGAAAAADIDLSTQEEVTITEKQGVISTFTLDGTTVHTIKIKTVDEVAGTVTIIIESDPIEITLKIGEMKEVDVDADGANDISVTLNKITDGAADITTKRLTPLPEKEVPAEEVPPTEKPAEEITPEVAPSKTWLWILIIVIIVVIGVGYWFMKRK